MSERRYTPGPWEVREVDGLFAVCHREGWVLESDDVEQDRADARLIAAAPEMFELLEDIDNRIGEITEEAWDRLQAILKRVKGNQ
jgi:hypothetical protein